MNSLFVIAPYKYEGMWVFDDPAVGLSKEPFIAGIDTMIDKVVASIPDADKGFRAIFSAAQFPRGRFQTEMVPRGIGGQLVLQRPIQYGRVALSGTLKILSERAAGDLREGRTERLTSESFAVIRVIKIAHQLHGLASAACR